MACPELQQYANLEEEITDDVAVVLQDTFLAASEGGFVLSRARAGTSETPWSCAIPGGLATLSWNI
ncbi:hypothetical protein B0H16DRAFT_1633930 [Mycena metata]|uniref:Uncharacterized protein n=1 Tax=Mycena metata TaxID=1033252 RepID=A0AAD7GX39_9AGAR|nr:hypothetical protein B0H16DRAFT_1633930 [Mycena metata]